MQIIRSKSEMPRIPKLGFVPTMGALHAGHISLVEKAKQDCDQICVSIFVNPLQFGPNEDFSKYPRTIDADLELLEKAGVDIVYLPEVTDIYPETRNSSSSVATRISTETELEKIHANPELANKLCGLNRPGHFDGVCTVVKRLFDIVQPQRAYFGEKDYQQLMIIREMVNRLKIPVEIISCPILREADGLAMSSRNRYLSAEERRIAVQLYQELLKVKSEILHSPTTAQKRDISHVSAIASEGEAIHQSIARLEKAGFKVDYLETHWNRIFIAAKLGNTRLIDNLAL